MCVCGVDLSQLQSHVSVSVTVSQSQSHPQAQSQCQPKSPSQSHHSHHHHYLVPRHLQRVSILFGLSSIYGLSDGSTIPRGRRHFETHADGGDARKDVIHHKRYGDVTRVSHTVRLALRCVPARVRLLQAHTTPRIMWESSGCNGIGTPHLTQQERVHPPPCCVSFVRRNVAHPNWLASFSRLSIVTDRALSVQCETGIGTAMDLHKRV